MPYLTRLQQIRVLLTMTSKRQTREDSYPLFSTEGYIDLKISMDACDMFVSVMQRLQAQSDGNISHISSFVPQR